MIIRSDLVHCPSLGVLEILHDHILGKTTYFIVLASYY